MILQHHDSVSTPRYGSYSKAYPVQKQSNPLLTAISWLLLLAALLLAVAAGGRTVLAWSSRDHALYAVVIDSGSSGTRIYAYNWTQPLSGGSRRSRAGSSSSAGTFPVVKAVPPSAAAHLVPKHASKGMYNRVETRPGLDTFAERPAGLSEALGPLLAWAQAVVPPAQHASTPLFFTGTGGLRRLPAQQQEVVLTEVRKQLGQSRFRFEPSWARVISGDDEGAFGWLALNYQQGRLRPHSHTATAAGAPAVATSITSLGALDLGGSSLQITFEVPATPSGVGSSSSGSGGKSAAVPAARPEYNITVAGHTFHLHLHSFKQYGLNEAYDRSVTHLLQQQQQQQQQQAAIKQQQDMAQQFSTLAGNATAAVSTAPPAKPALGHDSHIGSSSNISSVESTPPGHVPDAALVGAAIQHDLAVARAAGVHVDNTAASTAADAFGSAVLADAAAADPGSNPQSHSADTEQHRKADLAAAAAAGYHQHETQEAVSTAADTNLDSLQPVSSSSTMGTTTGVDYPSSGSSNGAVAGLGSSALQGSSSSHAGLQSAFDSGGAALHPGAAHLSAQPERSTGTLASPGLRLQGSKQPPAAARRRASARLRRSLLQQQLLWLEQLLGTASLSSSSSSSSNGQAGSASLFGSQLDSSSRGHALQQHEQYSHDVRLRQLLREYLLRDDPTLTATSAAASNSSSRAGVASHDGFPVAPHPVVPADAGSSSSTPAVVPVARLERAVDSHVGSSSANSSSSLQVVRHPCLHQGFEATYTRVVYEGIIPEPAKVLLRGEPDWESCLSVVNTVVNASTPCAVHEHLPSCVLGTPQPELQGNFMALTGFYVVSRFLGVQDRRTLDPLLDAAKTLCSRPWPWVQEHLGSNVNVERYCTWGPYVVKLLLHGLGLEEQHVYIAQDGDLGWPLGAVLVEASKLPGYSTAAGTKQRQHKKHGSKQNRSSLRGSATVLPREVLTPSSGKEVVSPAATAGTDPAEQADTVHVHTDASQEAGPAWSLGLLHHNQSSSGLHLSGPGWVVVLAVAWLVIVGWCRGVCGPKAAGPVALLPLAGMLSSTVGPGRAHVSGYIGRGKISPNRSSFKK